MRASAAILLLPLLLLSVGCQKEEVSRVRTVGIGDGTLLVDLPSFLLVEQEEDDIVLAYVPRKDYANLRFTILTIQTEDPTAARGEESVRKKALEKGSGVLEYGNKICLAYEDQSQQDGVPIVMKYWEVGMKNSLIIVSCCIDKDKLHDSIAIRVVNAVPGIIRSMRRQ